MAIPVSFKRRRGNPNWGRPMPSVPALPTEFELKVRHLQLTPGTYTSSRELYAWCQRNRNRVYIPEWLLKEWNIPVDPNISTAA